MTNSSNQREARKELQTITGASVSPRLNLSLFRGIVIARILILAVLMAIVTKARVCRAQETAPPPARDKDKKDSSTKPQGQGRMFGIMPAYGLVEAGEQPPPLSSGQKFKLAVQYLNPYTFLFVAAEAGVNQARNEPKEYGQGAEGYGKRYGAGFADGLTDGLFRDRRVPVALTPGPALLPARRRAFSHRASYD